MIRQSQAEVHTAASGSTVITEQLICEFVGSMQLRGCRPDSVKKYRHDLSSLYDFLPGEKRIGRNTLREWRAALAGEGYAPRTINAAVSVANSFLAWLGLREYQLSGQLSIRGDTQPALTRNEYLRLLSAARTLGRERAYLLTKVFATLGLTVQELQQLTTKAVRDGRLTVTANGSGRLVQIPACLRTGRPGVYYPKQENPEPYHCHRRDSEPCPCRAGGLPEVQPPVSAEALSGHHGRDQRQHACACGAGI